MPHCMIPWNSSLRSTKSIEVNNLIKCVKKKEVQKQGNAPQSQHSTTVQEFACSTVSYRNMLATHSEIIWRFGVPALVNYQFHLIAPFDDATQILLDHIQVHNSFSDVLKTKFNRTKMSQKSAPLCGKYS
jgi:hypothetical protein